MSGRQDRARELAELLGKPPAELAKAVALDAAAVRVTPETRGWLARLLAKADALRQRSAAKFHRGLKQALGQGGNAAGQAASQPEAAPAASDAGEQGHRLVTVHTGDPASPGHVIRMVRHPKRKGVWAIHPDDRERARELFGGRKGKGK